MATSILILDDRVIGALNRDLQALGRDLASGNKLRKPFEDIRDEVMRPSIETNFRVGGRPRWEPIREGTYNKRRFKSASFVAAGLSGSLHPLVDSGQMARAATAKARFTIKQNTMTYGNWPQKRWFGVVHNVPEIATKAGIPGRPFTNIQPEDINAIIEIMGDWIEKMVNQNIRRRYA